MEIRRAQEEDRLDEIVTWEIISKITGLSKENKRRKPLTAEQWEISSRGQTSKRLIAFLFCGAAQPNRQIL
jgi:hypothetical protein